MTLAAAACFVVVAVDSVLALIRCKQGRDTAYLYAGSAALFMVLGLNEMGVF